MFDAIHQYLFNKKKAWLNRFNRIRHNRILYENFKKDFDVFRRLSCKSEPRFPVESMESLPYLFDKTSTME
ncbi:MAG: hypothetical protein PHV55_08595, partial [Candidatus Omnitrophica bacterium]|nr:hypothetical protein [Candidatus Omnitrophota bacterium]